MLKPKVTKVDMMQKKTRHLFKIPLIISLGIALAIMIDQVAYGTGGFYESYYEKAPYSKTAPYGTHDGTNGCFDCHYGHDASTRTEFLTSAGVGVNACSGASCHTNAGNVIGRASSPVIDLYPSASDIYSPYQGIVAYNFSAHATVSNMFWPGAASTISAYPQISSDVTSAEGACFNCHNPHGQPDPDSDPTKPFLCKVVAGIDVCFEKDTGQTVNGITGNASGGVDPDTAENLCYACHGAVATNYDYSNRSSSVSIEDQFDRLSHHPVLDSDQSDDDDPAVTPYAWKVECNVCHNPHICQKSTRNSPPSSPISRVTDNTTLWGDKIGEGEKMSDYLDAGEVYQAPSGEPTAANLTDFNSFCLDCHGPENDYAGLSHDPIDWSATGDKHGKRPADVNIDIDSPYSNTNVGKYVLACTDCHEPHGSTNVYLTRTNVNNGALEGSITTFSTANWRHLCNRCHKDDYDAIGGDVGKFKYIHHNEENTDHPYAEAQCGKCHGTYPLICSNCHYHGSSTTYRVLPEPSTRITF